jgi:DNA-binding CsgD family transcriptional regulator
LKVGDDLRWLSRLAWFSGRGEDARKLAAEAIEILEQLAAGPELAMAYSTMAQLRMHSEDCPEAVEWGNRALELAERLELDEIVVHTLNNVGLAEILMGKSEGLAKLDRGLEIALKQELHEAAARTYVNLAYQALVTRDYARAAQQFADGLACTRERDLDFWTLYILAQRARAHLEQGSWQKAEDDARAVLQAEPAPVTRLVAVVVLGWVHLRRGSSGEAQSLLDEARERALATGDILRIGPVAAARTEAAWLRGDNGQISNEIHEAYELALKHPEPCRLGDLSLWLWRAGALDRPPDGIAQPYRLEMNGDWQAAAAAWERIGCPYEQALALAHGDRKAQLQALEILTRLGATPAATIVRRNLRADGLRGIPQGPRPETRGNPLGLTTRQMDILRLLAGDLSNKEIAARLRLSPKTVDHHVSAILAKLEVSTRREIAQHPAAGALLTKHRESGSET